MKRLSRTDLILLAIVIVFSAGTLLLKLTGQKENIPAEPEKAYYLTAYESPEELLAVQIANKSGTLTVVHHEGLYITDTALPGIEPDEEAVSQLFVSAARIRVSEPVAGADPEDPQFGLTKPSAQILVEDVEEKAISFLIGEKTPDESAYYVCAAGGKEVCTLSAGVCEVFLADINTCLDLGVFHGIDTDAVTGITVSDPEGMRYAVAASGKGNVTGAKYYSLSWPAHLPVALARIRDTFFASMDQLRAVDVSDSLSVPDQGLLYELSIETETGKKTYRVGYTKENIPAVVDMQTGVCYMIEALPEWLSYDAAGVLGGNLLSLNAANIAQITLETGEKTAQYDYSGNELHPQLTDRLNQIPISMADSSAADGNEVLRCRIRFKTGEEELELVFLDAGDRQRRISVNGKILFTCASSSLQPLLDNIEDSAA